MSASSTPPPSHARSAHSCSSVSRTASSSFALRVRPQQSHTEEEWKPRYVSPTHRTPMSRAEAVTAARHPERRPANKVPATRLRLPSNVAARLPTGRPLDNKLGPYEGEP